MQFKHIPIQFGLFRHALQYLKIIYRNRNIYVDMCFIVERLYPIKIEIIPLRVQNFVSKNISVLQALASLEIRIKSL